MNKQQLIDSLSEEFEDRKDGFLEDVRQAVSDHISGQGAKCLTLVENTESGELVWNLSARPAYVIRLIAFCRGKAHDGHQIDSGLTESVTTVVVDQFEQLYHTNNDEIAGAIMNYIIQDKVLSTGLVDSVVGSAAVGYVAGEIKGKATVLIIDQLKEILQTAGAKAVYTTVGKTVAAAASKPIATKIALLLMKFMATHLKGVIIKIFTSSAVKVLISAAVKKFLIVAIVATIVKTIGAKLGITASTAYLWFLLPIIGAFIYHEIKTFPDQLGRKVGDKVAEDLKGSYKKINNEVFDKVISEVFGIGINQMMNQLSKSAGIKKGVKELIRSLA